MGREHDSCRSSPAAIGDIVGATQICYDCRNQSRSQCRVGRSEGSLRDRGMYRCIATFTSGNQGVSFTLDVAQDQWELLAPLTDSDAAAAVRSLLELVP